MWRGCSRPRRGTSTGRRRVRRSGQSRPSRAVRRTRGRAASRARRRRCTRTYPSRWLHSRERSTGGPSRRRPSPRRRGPAPSPGTAPSPVRARRTMRRRGWACPCTEAPHRRARGSPSLGSRVLGMSAAASKGPPGPRRPHCPRSSSARPQSWRVAASRQIIEVRKNLITVITCLRADQVRSAERGMNSLEGGAVLRSELRTLNSALLRW